MAGFTHTLGVTYRTDAGQIASTTDAYTGNAETDVDDTVAGSAVDTEYDFAVDVSQVVSMVIYSNHALVLKTNSTSAPSDTVTLTANKQVVWNTDSVMTSPFTVDTTKVFVSNSSSASASLKIRVLSDVTP